VDSADVAKVEMLRDSLPPSLADGFEGTTDSSQLLDQLVALHHDLSMPPTAHAEADEQYSLWQLCHGREPIPVEVALAFFTEGEEIVSMDTIEAENRYLFPSYMKPEPPKKQQRASGDDADYVDMAPMEENKDGEPELSQETQEAYALAVDMGRPEARGFFTCRMSFHELLVRFERLEDIANIEQRSRDGGSTVLKGRSWLKKEEFEAITDDVLTIAEYRTLVQTLNKLRANRNSEVIEQDLLSFARPGEQRIAKAAQAELVDGGLITVGRRKNATAFVELRPWQSPHAVANQKWYGVAVPQHLDGITVNGQPLAEYFTRPMDMYEVLRPLEMANGIGKYKIDVKVRSGGIKGQAGAVRLGIARALVQLHPQLRSVLKTDKMLRRDPRMVERKKPGQKKARKKFQWVKR